MGCAGNEGFSAKIFPVNKKKDKVKIRNKQREMRFISKL